LAVDTVNQDVATCVELIVDYIETVLSAKPAARRSAG
jgi:hypothetical protein